MRKQAIAVLKDLVRTSSNDGGFVAEANQRHILSSVARPEFVLAGNGTKGRLGRISEGEPFTIQWIAEMTPRKCTTVSCSSVLPANDMSFVAVFGLDGVVRQAQATSPPTHTSVPVFVLGPNAATVARPAEPIVQAEAPATARAPAPTFVPGPNAASTIRVPDSTTRPDPVPSAATLQCSTCGTPIAEGLRCQTCRANRFTPAANRADMIRQDEVLRLARNEAFLAEDLAFRHRQQQQETVRLGPSSPAGRTSRRSTVASTLGPDLCSSNGRTHSAFLVPFLASAVEQPMADPNSEIERQELMSRFGDTWGFAALAAGEALRQEGVVLQFSASYLSVDQQNACWRLIENIPEVTELLFAMGRARTQANAGGGAVNNRHFGPGERKCPVPGCSYAPQSRSGPAMVQHLNTRHVQSFASIPQSALDDAGIWICSQCNQAVAASGNARSAHAQTCGRAFVSRNESVRTRTETFTRRPQAPLRRLENDAPQPLDPEDRTRREVDNAVDVASTFFTVQPNTKRWTAGHRENVRLVDATMSSCLRGFVSDQPGRAERMKDFLLFIRRKFSSKKSLGQKLAAPAAARKAAKVDSLVRIGAIGKALRVAASAAGSLAPTPEVLNALRALHPDGPQAAPLPRYPAPLNLTEDIVARAVSKLARGAAPGLDGWTRELLVPLTKDSACLTELTSLVRCIVAGEMDVQFSEMINASVLVALSKDKSQSPLDATRSSFWLTDEDELLAEQQRREQSTPSVRPIGMESAVLKLAGHVALLCLPEEAINQTFPAHQHGVGGSLEECIRRLRAAFSACPNMVALDMKNAYNSLHRTSIAQALLQNPQLGALYSLADLVLHPSRLILFWDGSAQAELLSQAGVKQGGVLSPLFFALVLQPTLVEAARRFAVTVEAYLDDVTVVGPAAVAAADWIRAEMVRHGLVTNLDKSFRICSPEFDCPSAYVTKTAGAVRILGSAFWLAGSEDQAREAIDAMIDKQHVVFERGFEDSTLSAWSRWHMLRLCCSGRAIFVARCHPAELTREALQRFDTWTRHALSSLIGTDFRDAAIDGFEVALSSLPVRYGGCGIRQVAPIAELCHAAFLAAERGLQKEHTTEFDAETIARVGRCVSEQERILLDAFVRIPPVPKAFVSDAAVRVALRQRLLMDVNVGVRNATVHGRTDLPQAPRTTRHDDVVQTLCSFAQSFGWHTASEPKRMIGANRSRPDALFVRGPERLATDVTVVFEAKARNKAASLADAATAKDGIWAASMRARGYDFVPFAVGQSGVLSAQAEQLISRLFPPASRAHVTDAVRACILEGNLQLFAVAQAQ